ncbi:MAG: CoA transferase [Sneathiellales bacterium]|nr:CoA transferase [Sneathiellales bacterium]
MSGPLDGLKIIDFSRVLAGPLCTRTLQDLGASVTKIEPPRSDVTRFAAPVNANGMSGYYAQQNAGKKNMSIDLNIAEAREIALKLCEEADILVENFRPGALEAFGLGYKDLSARNPRLIYVSLSGYGQAGPWKGRMAYAPTVQAESGFTDNTLRHFGENLSAPQTDPLSHADVYTGLQGVIAVLSALHHRDKTGEGQHVDVSMIATMIAVNERAHVDFNDLDLQDEPAILGATDGSFFLGPNDETFVTAMSLVGTATFRFVVAAMRRPDLMSDPRFATPSARRVNLEALKEIVQSWIWSFQDMATLDAQFDEAKVAIGEIRSLAEVAESEWAEYWDATLEVPDRNGGQFILPGRPWKFSTGELGKPEQPALQGEHNKEICKELGYSAAKIKSMEASGALVGNFASVLSTMMLKATQQQQASKSPPE